MIGKHTVRGVELAWVTLEGQNIYRARVYSGGQRFAGPRRRSEVEAQADYLELRAKYPTRHNGNLKYGEKHPPNQRKLLGSKYVPVNKRVKEASSRVINPQLKGTPFYGL